MTFYLEIITPEKVVFKDDVDELIVPTTTGEVGIMPNHVSLLTQISLGELIIRQGQKEHALAISGGFLDVANNQVTILADYAIRSEDIEIAKVEEAQKRAQKAMEEKVSERDFAEAEASLRRSLLELKVAQKRRKTAPIN
ncbi:MAG: F0F1 ATP synthase subunit epsilon [bacterium]|nr:F0F1 ATP synthase subunit epsilon [bacterium]